MVLQGRAGYTTGSQAEDGSRLGSTPLVYSGTGATPDLPPGGQDGPAPSRGIPEHSHCIPALGKDPCAWSSCCPAAPAASAQQLSAGWGVR